MKWSLYIGRFFGIGVYLHVTFLLLLGFIATGQWLADPDSVLTGVGLYVAVFGCVLLHEFGHALTARRFGIQTKDITLLPIGGVARLERLPEKPWHEFLVTIAGPAVNLVIALLLLPFVLLQGGFKGPVTFPPSEGPFIETLLLLNLWLVAFNLLPAFPMDGGRVLRSLLSMKLGNMRATAIAAKTGQVMAVLFVMAGVLLPQVFLIVIAFFVWSGAAQENRFAQVRDIFRGATTGSAMQTNLVTLEPNDTLARAAHVFMQSPQAGYPVLYFGRPVGVLLPSDLVSAVNSRHFSAPLAEAMRADVVTVQADDPLETSLEKLQASDFPVLLVERGGALAGLLTAESVGNFAAIHKAAEKSRHSVDRSTLAAVPPPLPGSR
jgi:Zn-dependent protease/CBS domain-containing protein